jgi:hypothetical protein
MAYALINLPANAKHYHGFAQELASLKDVTGAMHRLNNVLQEMLNLNDRTAQLYILLRNYKEEEGETAVVNAIKQLSAECDRQLQGVMRQVQGVPYPFEHTNEQLQLPEYIFQSYRKNLNPAAIYHCCEDVIATVTSLQLRCVGQLANMALRVETSLGLIRTAQDKSA